MPDSTILKTNYLTDEEIEEFYAPGGASEKTPETLKELFAARGDTLIQATGIPPMVTTMLNTHRGA